MKKLFTLTILITFVFGIHAQSSKKSLDEQAYFVWKTINHPRFSHYGNWVLYELNPNHGDGELALYHPSSREEKRFPRSHAALIDRSEKVMVFLKSPAKEIVDSLRREKIKEKDLPGDTLCVLQLSDQEMLKIPNIKKIQSGEEWDDCVFLQMDHEKDTIFTGNLPRKPDKKETFWLALRLDDLSLDTFLYVHELQLAEKAAYAAYTSHSPDSLKIPHIHRYEAREGTNTVVFDREHGELKNLAIDKTGQKMAFLYADSAGQTIPEYQLYAWDTSTMLSQSLYSAESLPDDWVISDQQKLFYDSKGELLFFGCRPAPLLQDSSLLPEEIVNVEIWSYQDGDLYTQQESNLEDEKKKTFLYAFHLPGEQAVAVSKPGYDQWRLPEEPIDSFALCMNFDPYKQLVSWEGDRYRDIYLVNLYDGNATLLAEKVEGNPRWSAGGEYVTWYHSPDSSWYLASVAEMSVKKLADKSVAPFYDEENDRPMYASSYGMAGWTEGDGRILLYDRYDIWSLDPTLQEDPVNLTMGREKKIISRYVSDNRDEEFINSKRILIRQMDEVSKAEAYVLLDLTTLELDTLYSGEYHLAGQLIAPETGLQRIFTRENFQTFPDLLLTDSLFSSVEQISHANPQQNDYRWGSIELVSWTDDRGKTQTGMLAKPEGFDTGRQYPMIVNFYERSSQNLLNHRAPFPHRSTINYTYYASNGYLIFNPDIYYEVGYPGASAWDIVESGTHFMIDQGFVDPDRIALQGHSWGGYQIAYILTKSKDLFACAEAGAPVVNMVSAYGGIRWGSGMSRMFQYEHTQSRLGYSLWENPDLYLENSPIFEADQIETPVLILHNDEDGAVPWYQGIEFFVAMRRLGKLAWMLNYNGEPHWPVKWQNRLDFNKRMFQFFEHYLKDEPMPVWMKEGIPAIHKGIRMGYEFGQR